MISLVGLLFVALATIAPSSALEEIGAKIHKVFALWGFAVIDAGKPAGAEHGDQLAIMTHSRKRASP